MPGLTAGTTSPAFLGGSNLAISAKSKHPDLAYELLQILVSPGYQKQFADAGHDPGAQVAARPASAAARRATAQAKAAENSRFVPSSENWAAVEASNILPDMIVAISGGADVKAEAAQGRRSDRGDPQRLSRSQKRSVTSGASTEA